MDPSQFDDDFTPLLSISAEHCLIEYELEVSLQVNYVKAYRMLQNSEEPADSDPLELRTAFNTMVNSAYFGTTLSRITSDPLLSMTPLSTYGNSEERRVAFQDETLGHRNKRLFLIRLSRSRIGAFLIRLVSRFTCYGSLPCTRRWSRQSEYVPVE